MKAISLVLGALFFCTLAQASEIHVNFRFFDEAGRELGPHHLIHRMTHGNGKATLSSGVFDLDTLQALKLNPGYPAQGPWVVTFSELEMVPRQGFMVHWNTASTGYSTFLLDNEGKGFNRSGTVIFNARLALDARNQLEHVLAMRPDYRPSSRFAELQERSDECFERLSRERHAHREHVLGQRCLDIVAHSMSVLMREYGIQNARAMPDAKWGVTIQPNSSRPVETDFAKIDDLVALFAPQHRWARLVMTGEEKDQFERTRAMVKYGAAHGVHLLGQLFDSTAQRRIPLEDFKRLVDSTLAHPDFEKIDLWEVGNEVNGQWLGPDMSTKIEYAARQVMARAPGKMRCLTFYWYSMQNSMDTSLFNWIEANITPAIRDSIDCVALSIYINQQPLGFSWDLILSKLSEIFPGKKVMVGEMGYRDGDGDADIFKEGPLDWSEEDGAVEFIQNRYASAFATPNSIGGGFWWYYDEQMAGKTSRWNALRQIYCAVYPQLCQISKRDL